MQFSEQVFIHLLLCQDIVLGAGDAGGWFIVSVLSGSQVSGHHPHHQGFHCGRSTFPPPLPSSFLPSFLPKAGFLCASKHSNSSLL